MAKGDRRSLQMRSNTIKLLNAGLVATLLALPPTRVISQPGLPVGTNALAENRQDTCDASVSFAAGKVMSAWEIRQAAIAALQNSGQKVEESLYCAINVNVLGEEPGCTVLFQNLGAAKYYVVGFDAKGSAAVRVAGRAIRHRTPRFGERVVGGVPKGGIEVNPEDATNLINNATTGNLAAPISQVLGGGSNSPQWLAHGKLPVAVFFGKAKVMGAEEVKKKAASALSIKGYAVADSCKCLINVRVQGKEPGCTVVLSDWIHKATYKAVFGGQGQLLAVSRETGQPGD